MKEQYNSDLNNVIKLAKGYNEFQALTNNDCQYW